ncbi:LamG-like jellyroll fold domain-containing protein, partial [Escherichia coli]
ANRLKAYVDGAQKTLTFNGTIPTKTTSNTTTFAIGKVGTDYSRGQVDDTWMYSRALSQAEVQDLFNMGSGDVIAPSAPTNLA